MAVKILLVSLAGGFLGLDRIVLQAMLSRPIVAAPLIGLLLGDAHTGLLAGALLELFWIDRLPVGTCIPPNDFLVAVLVASASILAGQNLGGTSRELITFSCLIYIPCGYLGQRADGVIFESNAGLSEGALRDAEKADPDGIFRKHLAGLGRHFFVYVLFILIFLLAGLQIILFIFPLLPFAVLRGLKFAYFFLPLLGVAAGLNTIILKGAIPVFCALFLAITLILELFHI